MPPTRRVPSRDNCTNIWRVIITGRNSTATANTPRKDTKFVTAVRKSAPDGRATDGGARGETQTCVYCFRVYDRENWDVPTFEVDVSTRRRCTCVANPRSPTFTMRRQIRKVIKQCKFENGYPGHNLGFEETYLLASTVDYSAVRYNFLERCVYSKID